MNGVTILLDGPLSGRARVVMNKVLRKVAPYEYFKWATSADEIETEVVVAMSDYDGHCLREAGVDKPGILKARGYRFDPFAGRVVVPTYSPWMVGKGKMNFIPVLIHDILRAMDEVGKPAPTFPYADLTLYPSPTEFREWCDRAQSSSFLAHDIETPFSKKVDEDSDEVDPSYEILRFSLATDQFKAITAPFTDDYANAWRELASTYRGGWVGWNSEHFDDPREASNGVSIDNLRYDAQWLHHFNSPMLPRGLGHVSTYYDRIPCWKHIGAGQDADEAALYSAVDARQTMVNFLGIKRAMEARQLV